MGNSTRHTDDPCEPGRCQVHNVRMEMLEGRQKRLEEKHEALATHASDTHTVLTTLRELFTRLESGVGDLTTQIQVLASQRDKIYGGSKVAFVVVNMGAGAILAISAILIKYWLGTRLGIKP